uniref:Uncharacterized protein n=1 Tax=Arundo donax TaxID=35708 RepID=A0A0A9AAT3_ARUDO
MMRKLWQQGTESTRTSSWTHITHPLQARSKEHSL